MDQIGAVGLAQLETGATGKDLSAGIRKRLHLLLDREFLRSEGFGFDALGQEKRFDGVALVQRDDTQRETRSTRFPWRWSK